MRIRREINGVTYSFELTSSEVAEAIRLSKIDEGGEVLERALDSGFITQETYDKFETDEDALYDIAQGVQDVIEEVADLSAAQWEAVRNVVASKC